MNNYPEHVYHGFDFCELHRTFNLPDYYGSDDSIVLKSYIDSVINKGKWSSKGNDFVFRYTAKQVRIFLRELYKDASIFHPDDARIYKAMYKMKSDYTLLQWFGDNCEKCWV